MSKKELQIIFVLINLLLKNLSTAVELLEAVSGLFVHFIQFLYNKTEIPSSLAIMCYCPYELTASTRY